jgi:3-isopropylmalate/(R)-2-methylmalate dehydratase large subunit
MTISAAGTYAPQGDMWERAVDRVASGFQATRTRCSIKEVVIDVADHHPAGDLGHQPGTRRRRRRSRPRSLRQIADPARRAAIETALDYMGLKGGAPIIGTPVDVGLHRVMHQ